MRCCSSRRRAAVCCGVALVTAVRRLAASARAQSLPCSNPRPLPRLRGSGMLVGVDEVGRGPLAGPVVAAAVGVEPLVEGLEEGVVDSKRLNEKNRELVYERLVSNAGVRWSVCVIEPEQIDSVNILQATFQAMAGAVGGLERQAVEIGEIVVDGNHVPPQLSGYNASSLIKGDQISRPVAAASIIAKVTRDRLMATLDGEHPQYGFLRHKGYGTKEHLEALMEHGPCPAHRMTFNPIKRFWIDGSWDPVPA